MQRKLDIQIPKSQDETNILAQNELDQIENLPDRQVQNTLKFLKN